jgi:hypothetical protein
VTIVLRRKGQVYRITEAPRSLSDDIGSRQRKYAISMGVRAVAFVVAAIAPLPVPLRVLLIIAALVIPYVAVVYANGGREPTAHADSPYEPPEPRAITPTVTVLGSPGAGGAGGAGERANGHGQHADTRSGDDPGAGTAASTASGTVSGTAAGETAGETAPGAGATNGADRETAHVRERTPG